MQLSKTMLAISPSPTVALNGKANAMKAAGKEVLNFAVGEPDFATPQAIRDVGIKAIQDGKTKYGPAGGSPELRQAIADKLQRENQLTYSPNDIVCGMGAKEILLHIFMSILNQGDEVILTAPHWVSYPEQIKACGAQPVIVPTPQDMGKNPIDISAIEAAITDKTTCFVLNSPNNPVGYVLSKSQLLELGALLKKHPNLWVVTDEIYEYLSFDDDHHSILGLCPELAERTIVVNGFSKGFAMTGWRVGYCAGPSEAMKMVRGLQSHSSTCLPPFIEAAATFAIKQGRTIVEKELQSMRKRRDLAVQLVSKIPQLKFSPPQGAFYLFLAPQTPNAQNTLQFCERLLEQYGVAMVPGEAFSAPGYLRMSYATDEATLERGISRLAEALAE